jgi:hypothetical protein
MEDALADLDEIRDATAEARLLQAGSRSWWRAVTAALSACAEHFDRQDHGVLAEFRSRTDRTLRRKLGGQWLAFVTARICDLTPDSRADQAVCQRCQWPLSLSHRHVLSSDSWAVFCTCDCCYQLYRQVTSMQLPDLPGGRQSIGPGLVHLGARDVLRYLRGAHR